MTAGNIGKIKASRVNNVPNVDAYLGEKGILFYNYANGVIRMSDGITPGGVPIPYTVASVDTVGGIKAGPGANIAQDGLLTIDTAGLPLSIGNLSFIDTSITTLTPDVDLSLYTNGTGNINLIGSVRFFKPDGPIETRRPFFEAANDGQLTILIPAEDPLEGGVEIIGSASGNYVLPGQSGTMLQITGNPGIPTRVYLDGNSEYSSLIARRYNGNVAAPTQVLAGQDVFRINSTAATNLNGGNVGNVAMAQIRTTALENQTATAQGSSITFTVTPVGSPASARVDVANVTVAHGITATKFTTSGNITGGNLNLSGNVTANYVAANNFGNVGNVEIEAGSTYWYFNTNNTFTGTGNVGVGNISATHSVTAKNYSGQARDAGTLGAAGTLTINFATDHNVLVNLTTTATIAFANITPGKTVTVLVKNATGANRAVTLGVLGTQTSGGNPAPNVNDNRTGVFVYRTFGTATTDVYCEVN